MKLPDVRKLKLNKPEEKTDLKFKFGDCFSKNRLKQGLVFALLALGLGSLIAFFLSQGNLQLAGENSFLSPLIGSKRQTSVNPTASIEGIVLNSFDNEPQAGVVIKLTGEQDFTASANSQGEFYFDQLPVGSYNLQLPDKFLPESQIINLTSGEYKKITLKAEVKDPQPSQLEGVIFEDENRNNQPDEAERGLNASVRIYKIGADGQEKLLGDIWSSGVGEYGYVLEAPAKYLLEPGYVYRHTPPLAQTITVRGLGEAIKVDFGHIPQVVRNGLIIYVFNDQNENGQKDEEEEFVIYQAVKVKNKQTGQERQLTISNQGSDVPFIEFGEYVVELAPENEEERAYKITKGQAEVVINSKAVSEKVYLGVRF